MVILRVLLVCAPSVTVLVVSMYIWILLGEGLGGGDTRVQQQKAPSPTCNCGLEDQTVEHVLERCPLLQTVRKKMCGRQQSSYTPNSMAAKRNRKRWPHASCRLDFQRSGNDEEAAESCSQEALAFSTIWAHHQCLLSLDLAVLYRYKNVKAVKKLCF